MHANAQVIRYPARNEALAKNIHPASSETEQKSSAKHVTTQPSTQGMGNYSILRGMSN